VAFSGDRKVLAATSKDENIRLWNAESGDELRRLTDHGSKPDNKARVHSLAFSPDDRSVAAGASDGSVRLWDVATGKERLGIAAPVGKVMRGASPDGPNILAFSPDGTRLAVGYTGVVLDAATGKELVRLEGHHRWLRCLCFSPDGKSLAGEDLFCIRLWDAATGKEVFKDTAHRDPVCSLAFFPDGKTLATTSWDRTVHRWEAATGRELSRFRGRGRPAIEANQVAVAPDGRSVAAWLGNVLYRWDVGRPDSVEEFRDSGGSNDRRAVAFTARGRMLAAASRWEDRRSRVWEGSTAGQPRLLAGEDVGSNGFVFSPDGKIVASAGPDGRARVWDVATGKLIHALQGFTQPSGHLDGVGVFSIALSPDGTALALGSSGGDIALWDPVAGKELLRLTGPTRFVEALAFSPDGKTLAAGYADGVIRLWELAVAAVRREWRAHPGAIRSLALSPDGRLLASGSTDTTVLIWDALGALPGAAEVGHLTTERLDTLWADLGGGDAAKAYRAIGVLAAVPERSLPLLAARLLPVSSPDPGRLARLITNLDRDQFAVRDQATRELEGLGELAEAALRKLLAAKPPLEVRRRAEGLLEKLRGPLPFGDRLRSLRAVEALEHVGTKQARQVLIRLAGGGPEARLTREAKAALQRLARRTAGKP
jgi:WD40 repeat protein